MLGTLSPDLGSIHNFCKYNAGSISDYKFF